MFALPVDFAVGLALTTLALSFVLSLVDLLRVTRPVAHREDMRQAEVSHDC